MPRINATLTRTRSYAYPVRLSMQTITATELARRTREVLDNVASRRQTVAIERNHALIATISPAEQAMTAAEALAHLPPPMLNAAQAAEWLKGSRTIGCWPAESTSTQH